MTLIIFVTSHLPPNFGFLLFRQLLHHPKEHSEHRSPPAQGEAGHFATRPSIVTFAAVAWFYLCPEVLLGFNLFLFSADF